FLIMLRKAKQAWPSENNSTDGGQVTKLSLGMLLRLVTTSVWLLTVSVTTTSSAVPEINFDNALTEKPSIECGHGRLAVSISTEKQPPSHVNPRGMAFSMTVVVQLHPLFITKVDRAFHVRCFYMEAEKAVGAQIGVKIITELFRSRSFLNNISDPPDTKWPVQQRYKASRLESLSGFIWAIKTIAKYSYREIDAHEDSANGPLIKLAQVGDIIYHVWDCPSEVYGMMIHDCSIVDGQGNNHTVIDSEGCSTDTFLMPELTYSSDLTKSFTPPRCGPQSSHDDSLANDLDSDQLITPTQAPATTTVTWSTTTPSPSTTYRPTATTAQSTTVYTTVTELTSTAAPTTSATILKTTEFPMPDTLHDYVRKTADILGGNTKMVDDIEGSGVEILKFYQPTPVSLIRADHIPEHEGDVVESDVVQLKREMRRREAEAIDVDISSPELTIIDKDI
ncbi:hypothetical protein TELCIR_12361, partial [Teladorsagia circumcincta]